MAERLPASGRQTAFMPVTHILLVEDNVTDAMLIREHLHEQRWHYEWTLVHAGTLAQARQKIEEQPPDAILLDLHLPDSHGVETYSRIQQMAPRVPIVVFSGESDEATALSTIRLGAQDYLPKHELNGLLLARTLRYAIERHRFQAELSTALSRIKGLYRLLPICGRCKKIREDDGYWKSVEAYITEHCAATFSHSLCPDCVGHFHEQVERLIQPPRQQFEKR